MIKFIPLFSNSIPGDVASEFIPLAALTTGNGNALLVVPMIGEPGLNDTTTTYHTDDADAVVAGLGDTNGLDVSAFSFGWNGATWDRLRTLADDTDTQAALGLGLRATIARLQGWDDLNQLYNRLGALIDDDDNNTPVGISQFLAVINRPHLFNGATFDRERNNEIKTILASAVRNATNTTADQENFNAKGIHLFWDITAVPGVDTVELFLGWKDPVSAKFVETSVLGPIAAVSFLSCQVYPSTITAGTFDNTINAVLSRIYRLRIEHSGAGNFTYSVGAALML